MRLSFWLLIATALTGCAEPGLEGKAVKNASISSKQEVKLRLAHATEEGGDLTGAEKMYQQVAQQTPNSSAAQLELGEFYLRHHADAKAIVNLTAAQKLEPDNTNITRELANIYIGSGEPEKAVPLLDGAIALNRKDALLYNSKGVALDEMGDYREAQKYYKTAYDLDPVGGITYKVNISMSYILAGDYQKAIDLLRPMLTAPEAPPIIRQNLALAYGMKGENETALKLGLEDLSTSEAEENIRFYRMLAHKHATSASIEKASSAVSDVPASDIRDIFTENKPPTSSTQAMPVDNETVKAAAVKPVVIQDEEADSTAPVPAAKSLPTTRLSADIKPLPSSEDDSDVSAPAKPALTSSLTPEAGEEKQDNLHNIPKISALPEPVLKPDNY